jgi:hypothetical protein
MYGTTAVVAVIDPDHKVLWVGNLGNCQAVEFSWFIFVNSLYHFNIESLVVIGHLTSAVIGCIFFFLRHLLACSHPLFL